MHNLNHNPNLLGRAQPVIPPNLYLVYEHDSLGSSGKTPTRALNNRIRILLALL